MALDYYVLFVIGYLVGMQEMNDDLMPILNQNKAQLLSMQSKIAETTWLHDALETAKKEINE